MFLLRGAPRLVAFLTLAAVLVVTAGPASAATGSVQVGPKATLVAHGVALDVPVTISLSCDEGFDVGLVDLFVVQARGTSVVFGSGQATFACTGETQNLTVRVFGGVFHGGTALATASLLQCRFEAGFGLVCYRTDISTNEEVMIRGGS
jgi:hypothetical protein